jgi:predicted phage terminase large subunit-like protein
MNEKQSKTPYEAWLNEPCYPAIMLKAIEQVNCEESLLEFVRRFWHIVEPGRELVESRMLEELCAHLEAVTLFTETDGEDGARNMLINVPPGCMKSLLVNVFWPAWEWGPRNLPHLRYINASYSEALTLRDNLRFLNIIRSPEYQAFWGDRVVITKDSETKVSNAATGWKIATSVGGLGTGERGDRFCIDDPHNIKDGESDAKRKSTLLWWREVVPTRLNDAEKSCKVIIMQRVHEEDVSGDILTRRLDYVHLCLAMEFDSRYPRCETPFGGDWREDDGELLCPERFSQRALNGYNDSDGVHVPGLKEELGPYACAAQLQQTPTPRGGGILKDEWWQLWDEEYAQRMQLYDPKVDKRLPWPVMEYVAASLDTAFKSKQENDYHALVILGMWRDENDLPRVMVMMCWKKHLTLHGDMPPKKEGETDLEYLQRNRKHWGLVEWVVHSCRRLKVDKLLIEDSAKGKDVEEELLRLFSSDNIGVELIPATKDKIARAHATVPIFSGGSVFAPDTEWAAALIKQCSNFPKISHDDDVDALTQGLLWLRRTGWALRREERDKDLAEQQSLDHAKPVEPLYDV